MNNVYQKAFEADPEFRKSRLASLFSDFHQLSEINPEGYAYNLNVWEQYLKRVFTKDKIFQFRYDDKTVKELTFNVEGKAYIPNGLYIVINNLINQNEMIRLDKLNKLEKEKKGAANKGGIVSTLKNLIFGSYIENVPPKVQPNQSIHLIYLPVLKEIVQKVKGIVVPILRDEVLNFKYIKLVLEDNGLSFEDVELKIVLDYLCYSSEELNLTEDCVLYTTEKRMELESEDKEIEGSLEHLADLNYIIHQLTKYIDVKRLEVKKFDDNIKALVKENSMVLAKSQLRLKKLTETQIVKTVAKLENVQTLKINVEEAQNNNMVAHIWKENAAVLKTLNKQSDSLEIDDMLDELTEEIAETNLIGDKLSQRINANNELVNDEELDNELIELEKKMKGTSDSDNKVEEVLSKLDKKFSELEVPETIQKAETQAEASEKQPMYA